MSIGNMVVMCEECIFMQFMEECLLTHTMSNMKGSTNPGFEA